MENVSRRDYFAGCALTGLLARPMNMQPDEVSEDAFQIADAMIEAAIQTKSPIDRPIVKQI